MQPQGVLPFFSNKPVLFVYFGVRWVFAALLGLSLVAGSSSSFRVLASPCGGFCGRARALGCSGFGERMWPSDGLGCLKGQGPGTEGEGGAKGSE